MSPPEEPKEDSEGEAPEDRKKKLERLKNMVFDQGQGAARVLKMWLHKDNG